MNTLVLMPGSRHLRYSLFHGQKRLFSQLDDSYANHSQKEIAFCARVLKANLLGQVSYNEPRLIGCRMVHGGPDFAGPVLYDASVRTRLEAAIPFAPARIPAELLLLEAIKAQFPSLPIVLLFESSFFTRLPFQEFMYGLPDELSREPLLRRFGVHGLYHETTCERIEAEWAGRGTKRRPRALSICLDPKPEVTAAVGVRPVMTTGGMSPLEGLPGQTTCGEMDPGILLYLAHHLDWAPEKIDRVLTQQSGMLALAERDVTIGEVLGSSDPALQLTQEVLKYRFLQACGAGIAVLRRVDVIGYSGRFTQAVPALHEWLLSRLPARVVASLTTTKPFVVAQDIEAILAERAQRFIQLEQSHKPASSVPMRRASLTLQQTQGDGHVHH